MGEVYRADDLTLGQTVALKFLPAALAADRGALARFHREVRVARQITHPNVCRVYDIGEAEGRHFLSMEFISGEELASVLKRFGRLPADKATEIARQICAGLDAAHRQGIVHRDLKPANVMIDAEGVARVTDFGLAAFVEDEPGNGAAGTPAYMSPEQLAGRELTTGSDIYSLGLVLYELFTGRRAFDAATLPELLRLRRSGTRPSSPTDILRDLDPLIERAILRCLEEEPGRRPASALQVAAALPGGDPLAAAVALGETPSPEMVAAAPKEGTLRPALAVACLAALLAGLAAVVLLSSRAMLHRRVPLVKPPEVLKERAAGIVKRLGYTDAPADDAHGFSLHTEFLRYVSENDASPARWDRLGGGRPSAIAFWYRQSPQPLVPQRGASYQRVGPDDPPPLLPGMASALLDTHGRLLRFEAVPPQVEERPEAAAVAEPDWRILFSEAGLDQTSFTPDAPKWVPPVNSDVRRAWEGASAEAPGTPLRVEAAGFRGRTVYFRVVEPWHAPGRAQAASGQSGNEAARAPNGAAQLFRVILILITLTAGVLLARHNLRAGRGDRRGALRLAVFTFAAGTVAWLLEFSHIPSPAAEFDAFFRSVMARSFSAGLFWLLYVALEPYVRRRWPHRIISWSRLLAGDWRDPLVGRDVLLGGLCGVAGGAVVLLSRATPRLLGLPEASPHNIILSRMLGMRQLIAGLLSQDIGLTLSLGLGFLFLLLVFYIILRREWLAVGVLFVTLALLFSAMGEHLLIMLPFGALWAAAMVFVLTRLGLLATTSFLLFQCLCVEYPLTTDFSVWYAEGALFALGVAVALAVYGFRTSLAGRSLFGGRFVQD
jgi:serine/threonine-protein kinase